MIAVMLPVTSELAEDGRCWSCKQWFAFDDYYFQLSLPTDDVSVMATCTGCTAQLVCDPV